MPMTTVNPYLQFNGNCEEAFSFYQSVFGGEFLHVGRFGDMPSQDGAPPLNEEDKRKIMHISLPISDETLLMGSDTFGDWAAQFVVGSNFSVSITTDSRANADRLFDGLSAGGQVIMAMNQTFWGSYFGMFADKFGVNWMISFDVSKE